jgi:hypothetical protein
MVNRLPPILKTVWISRCRNLIDSANTSISASTVAIPSTRIIESIMCLMQNIFASRSSTSVSGDHQLITGVTIAITTAEDSPRPGIIGNGDYGAQQIVTGYAVAMETVDILCRDFRVLDQSGIGNHVGIRPFDNHTGIRRPGDILMTVHQPLHHPGGLDVDKHRQVSRKSVVRMFEPNCTSYDRDTDGFRAATR